MRLTEERHQACVRADERCPAGCYYCLQDERAADAAEEERYRTEPWWAPVVPLLLGLAFAGVVLLLATIFQEVGP